MSEIECKICHRYFDEADIIWDIKGNTLCVNCNWNYEWNYELDRYVEN